MAYRALGSGIETAPLYCASEAFIPAELIVTMRPAYRTYVLIILMFTYMLNISDRMIMSILMEDIKAEFVLSDTQMGLLAGLAFTAFYIILGIPIARLADRSNRRNVLAAAVTLWSAMTALCGAATGFWSLFMARLGVGVGEAGGNPPASSIIADYFDKHELARAMGIFALGGTIGTALGLIGGGMLADLVGWRMSFVLLGLPGVFLGGIVFLTVREPQRGRYSTDKISQETFLKTLRSLASNHVYRRTLLANGVVMIVAYAFSIWLAPILLRTTALSTANVGLVLGLVTLIGGVPGLLFGGYLADKLSRGKARWRGLVPAIACLTALPLLVLCLLQTKIWAVLGLYTLAYSCLMATQGPALAVLQAYSKPGERALASSLNSFVATGLGYGIGPILTGLLSDALVHSYPTLSLNYAVIAMTLFLIPGALLYYRAAKSLDTHSSY